MNNELRLNETRTFFSPKVTATPIVVRNLLIHLDITASEKYWVNDSLNLNYFNFKRWIFIIIIHKSAVSAVVRCVYPVE